MVRWRQRFWAGARRGSYLAHWRLAAPTVKENFLTATRLYGKGRVNLRMAAGIGTVFRKILKG